MLGWTGEHVRHVGEIVRQGRNPAARVYESIGPDFFLALSPGSDIATRRWPRDPVELLCGLAQLRVFGLRPAAAMSAAQIAAAAA
jgi:hypothetical protein